MLFTVLYLVFCAYLGENMYKGGNILCNSFLALRNKSWTFYSTFSLWYECTSGSCHQLTLLAYSGSNLTKFVNLELEIVSSQC